MTNLVMLKMSSHPQPHFLPPHVFLVHGLRMMILSLLSLAWPDIYRMNDTHLIFTCEKTQQNPQESIAIRTPITIFE